MESNFEALKALAERLEKATGPSHEIDFAIARLEGWTQHTDEANPVYVSVVSTWWAAPGEEWSSCSNPPTYSASIDAALALVERVLPGWVVEMEVGVGSSVARLRECHGSVDHHGDVSFHGLPIAILRAMVAALLASGSEVPK